MGSAIESFDGAQAVAVPRDRFAPVKTTNDLLVLWSDAYELTTDEVRAALAHVDQDRVDATVMSGTGMLTLPAILAARRTVAPRFVLRATFTMCANARGA